MVDKKFENKEKLSLVFVLGLFLVLSMSFAFADSNFSEGNQSEVEEIINVSVEINASLNESLLVDNVEENNDTIEIIEEINDTIELNESVELNESIELPLNESIEELNSSDDLILEEPLEEIIEINESIEFNDTEINDTLEIGDVLLFGLMGNPLFGVMGALANSTNYRLDLFLLGIHAISTPYPEGGDDLLIFSSFSDGTSGSAKSANYQANIGPLGTFTDYEQCYRQTCSELGYTCDRWEDSCEGYLHCGDCATDYNCFTGFCKLDADNDTIPDSEDSLIGQIDDLDIVGLSDIDITIGGVNPNGTFSGVQDVIIYSGSDIVVEFEHNFSAGVIDFRELYIQETTDAIIVNFANELLAGETKTVYIYDHEFVDLCVEDAEIAHIDDISPDCSGAGEIDFEGCIGGSVTISGITCTDLGSRIKVENLSHSGIEGLYFHPSAIVPGGGVAIYEASEEEMEEGYEKTLAKGGEIKFELDGEEHLIIMKDITDHSIELLIQSEERIITILLGETEKIDLNNDGLYDLEIFLKDINFISFHKATIVVKALHEAVTQLFDITFNLEDNSISDVNELIGIVTFESFGNVPTPVDLTFVILDESGNEIYRETGEITVMTEEVLRWNYEGLELENGKYTAVLETLYNVDIRDEFRQEFEIGKEKLINNWIWYLIVAVIIALIVIISISIKRRRGKRR